jgi:hypothetical protein
MAFFGILAFAKLFSDIAVRFGTMLKNTLKYFRNQNHPTNSKLDPDPNNVFQPAPLYCCTQQNCLHLRYQGAKVVQAMETKELSQLREISVMEQNIHNSAEEKNVDDSNLSEPSEPSSMEESDVPNMDDLANAIAMSSSLSFTLQEAEQNRSSNAVSDDWQEVSRPVSPITSADETNYKLN